MKGSENYGISINVTNVLIVCILIDMVRYHGRKLFKSDKYSNDFDFHQYQYGIGLFLLIANMAALFRSFIVYYTEIGYMIPDILNFATFIDRFAMMCAYSYMWFMGRKYRIDWFE